MEFAKIEGEIQSVIVSSVVPQVLFNLRVLADRYFHTRAKVVGRPDVRLPVPPRVDPNATSAPTGWSTRWAPTTATAAT